MLSSDAGEILDTLNVGSPCIFATSRRFRFIDGGECRSIDDGAIQVPVNGGVGFSIGDIERIGVVIFKSV